MNDVLGIVPPPSKIQPVIIGLIPCYNMDFLQPAWSVVRPGVEEVAQIALGEFSALSVYQGIYSGRYQLYLAYLDPSNTATEENNQRMFIDKLRTPDVDFGGFCILDIMRNESVHVFAVYIMPQYRGKNLWDIGVSYIEKEIKKIGAKVITSSVQRHTLDAMKARGYEEALVNVRKKI
jgi:GNAT superfamily N-acetyltransferase